MPSRASKRSLGAGLRKAKSAKAGGHAQSEKYWEYENVTAKLCLEMRVDSV
jgi:hypothetical protein